MQLWKEKTLELNSTSSIILVKIEFQSSILTPKKIPQKEVELELLIYNLTMVSTQWQNILLPWLGIVFVQNFIAN
jgi:hypothetical protein